MAWRSKVLLLLTYINEQKSELFCDDKWLSRLAYMADHMFDHLNVLNTSLRNLPIFYANDKISAFTEKVELIYVINR